MKYKISAITHVGNYRHINEDAILIGKTLINGVSINDPILFELEGKHIVAVADGMGGHPAGHIASEIVLYYLRENFYEKGMEEIDSLIHYVKKALDENIILHPERKGMGTTLSFVILGEDTVKIGHVGDSRIYVIDDTIKLLTKDFTEAWSLYEEGKIGYDEIRRYPLRSMLTSALIGDGEDYTPEFLSEELKANRGSYILLCTDGLWENFKDEEILNIVKNKDIKESASILLRNALERGGYDNISFIIVHLV